MMWLRTTGFCALVLSLATPARLAFAAQAYSAGLDPTLAARAEGKSATAHPAAGARVIEGPGGKPGFEPGTSGAACRVTVPEGALPLVQGTVSMYLRVSNRIGHAEDGTPATVTLIDSPAIRLQLRRHRDCAHLLPQMPAAAGNAQRVCRIAYLDPGKWYHLAISWNAETGEVDLFINGWAQQRVNFPPWKPAGNAKGDVLLGGVLGAGEDAVRIAVSRPELWAWHMTEARMRTALKGRELCEIGSEVRKGLDRPLDLSGYELEAIYTPDFSKPLPIVHEDTFFDGDRRVREPKPGQWVLEGPGKAFVENGMLTIDNLKEKGDHVVLWMPLVFPENFLLEFDITIERADTGLAIVFFAARPKDDPSGSISSSDSRNVTDGSPITSWARSTAIT